MSLPVPAAILAAWDSSAAAVKPFGAGLINQTYVVDGGPHRRFVLQRLHAIFPAEVNEDIEAVTRHLAAKALLTPHLLRTREGALWVKEGEATWRALSWVEGVALDRMENPAQAREAGAVLARFHRAVGDLRHEFRHARGGVHDTARHLANLRRALHEHAAHPRYAEIAPLAERILQAAAALPPLPATPARIVHGDPKANNILFAPDRRHALCLIDLDTLSRMQLPLELGDAFRSWCNPAGEDQARASFSLPLFEAAVEGYAEAAEGFAQPEEWQSFVTATETIYVELAARFCADALEERYFGWNAERYATRGEHNQVRAESQLAAAKSLAAQRPQAEAALQNAFGG